MVLPQRNVENYLTEFGAVFREIDRRRAERKREPLSQAFYWRQCSGVPGASSWKGARASRGVFYKRHRIATPSWLVKVDAGLTGSEQAAKLLATLQAPSGDAELGRVAADALKQNADVRQRRAEAFVTWIARPVI